MHKNTLQEFCQKNKLLMPTYNCSTLKDCNQPKFVSTVTITYNNQTYTAEGSLCNKKKQSEISAASRMLEIIDNIRTSEIEHYDSSILSVNNNIYILIDLENVHMGNFFEPRRFKGKFHFIGFASENHPSINVAPHELQIITIKSDRRDAADTLIIGYTATLIEKEDDLVIVIVTKDHFGPGLVDYIHNYNPNIKASNIKTVKELGEYFKTL